VLQQGRIIRLPQKLIDDARCISCAAGRGCKASMVCTPETRIYYTCYRMLVCFISFKTLVAWQECDIHLVYLIIRHFPLSKCELHTETWHPQDD
jgi:hypothetical protein